MLGGLYLGGVFSKAPPKEGNSPEVAALVTPPASEQDPKAEPRPEPKPSTKAESPRTKGKGKAKNTAPPTPIELPKIEQDPEPLKKAPPVPVPKVVPKIPEPTLTWASPFNGKDATGWDIAEASAGGWKAANVELIGTGTEKVSRQSVLLTRGAYRNFMLRFEANSDGVTERKLLLRARTTDDRIRGYAIHLSGPRAALGAFAAYNGDPIRCPPTWQQTQDNVRPTPGEWTVWEVVCIGPRIHVKVAGRPVADWELDQDIHASGGFGFSTTGTTELRTRRLAVADLPDKPLDAMRSPRSASAAARPPRLATQYPSGLPSGTNGKSSARRSGRSTTVSCV